jgi:hypothetical protein
MCMGQKIVLTFSVALVQFPPYALTLHAQGAKNRLLHCVTAFLAVFRCFLLLKALALHQKMASVSAATNWCSGALTLHRKNGAAMLTLHGPVA